MKEVTKMPDKEYEEFYCTYCDSQRCVNRVGETLVEVCPYWEARQKDTEE